MTWYYPAVSSLELDSCMFKPIQLYLEIAKLFYQKQILLSLFEISGVCSMFPCNSMFMLGLFPVSSHSMRRPASCYPSDVDTRSDLCGGHHVRGEIHRGAVKRPAAVIQAWLMSLWQRTEEAMLVSAGSQTLLETLLLFPPPSFNGLGLLLTILPCTSESLILMLRTDRIFVIMCCID